MTEEVRDKQVIVRVTEAERELWKQAAEAAGIKVSEWLRNLADRSAHELLTCTHPKMFRKAYPWSEFCDSEKGGCGQRLRDQQTWLIPEWQR